MPNIELQFQPGVDLENTSLSNKGRWVASNWVRFRSGRPEKIGGWQSYAAQLFVGVCRMLFNWITLAGQNFLAVGTSQKLYIEYGQGLYDITPIRRQLDGNGNQTGAQAIFNVSNNFSFTSGSPVVKISITAHGAAVGDWVDITGMTGGPYAGITIAQLNQGFKTVANPSTGGSDANNVWITVSSNASSTVNNTGGTNGTTSFEVSVGEDIVAVTAGWGSNSWGTSPWGMGTLGFFDGEVRYWHSDAFGQDLVCNIGAGPIFYWPSTSFNSFSRAVYLSAYCSDPNTPLTAEQVLVTPYRHVMVFGTQPVGSTTADPMYLRWSDQENITGASAWTSTQINQAGGIRLTDGSQIMIAKKTKQEILCWTNSALYSIQFIGTPYIYSVTQVGTNISLMGDNAIVTVSGQITFWMGINKFYMYNGVVSTLPCALRKYVFTNIDTAQFSQVYAFSVERFNEVWWLYVSKSNLNGDSTNDSYVMFNYVDNTWAYGTIARTAWLDTPLRPNPVAAGNGYLYYQEYGTDDGTNPAFPAPINAFIESADIDIQQGDKFAFIKRIMPDVSFIGSPVTNPQCNMTISVRRKMGLPYDNSNALEGDPGSITRTATNQPVTTTAIVEQFTPDVWVRLRGRLLKFRIDSTTLGTQWQLGTPIVNIQPDGRR